jgi:hypothetical protein
MVTTFFDINKKETIMLSILFFHFFDANLGGPFGKWTFQKCPKSSSEKQTWKSDFFDFMYLLIFMYFFDFMFLLINQAIYIMYPHTQCMTVLGNVHIGI